MNKKHYCLCLAFVVLFASHTVQATDFPALIEAARSDFQPVGEQNLQLALTKMRSAQRAVGRFLADRPKYAEGWRVYLRWDEQNRQLAKPTELDAPFWRAVYLREFHAAAGLDHTAFREHRAATRQLINVLESSADASLDDRYQKTLDELSSLLGEDITAVKPDQAEAVSQLVEQLDQQQQAPDLVKAIREAFSLRNILIYVPDSYIDRDRSGSIKQSYPVNTRVAGASVRGSGTMTAQYEWSPEASSNGATWRMEVHGDSVSRTTAYQNRISVGSRSSLPFQSWGKVTFDLSGFRVSDFTTSGRLRLRTTSIRTPFRGIRHRIARNRAIKQQGSSRYRSERNAKRDISSSFRHEIESQVAEANDRYREEVLLPLKCFDQMPSDSMVRTTDDSVHVGLRLANSRQLGALDGINDFYGGQQFRLAVHQSALNNAAMSLAGKTQSLGALLRQLQPEPGEKLADKSSDVDITFAEISPLMLSLNDEKIVARISGKGFRRGGQKYSAMEIEFCYALRYEQGEHFLELNGEPTIAHPLSPDGTRPKLGIRDLSLRRILLSVIKRDLPEKVALDQLDLPLQRDLLGPLRAVRFESQNGWALLEAVRPQDLEPLESEPRDVVVPVSFNEEQPTGAD